MECPDWPCLSRVPSCANLEYLLWVLTFAADKVMSLFPPLVKTGRNSMVPGTFSWYELSLGICLFRQIHRCALELASWQCFPSIVGCPCHKILMAIRLELWCTFAAVRENDIFRKIQLFVGPLGDTFDKDERNEMMLKSYSIANVKECNHHTAKSELARTRV